MMTSPFEIEAMKRWTFNYTYPVLDEQMEEWDKERSSFKCDANSMKEAEKLFDKHCENEYHDETWDYDQIEISEVTHIEIGEPEDPDQLRLFKKPKESPYVPPPLQFDFKQNQTIIAEPAQPRTKSKARRHVKRNPKSKA